MQEFEGHLSRSAAQALRKVANTTCIKNAERDLHQVFREEGLRLPVDPAIAPGLLDVHYLSVESWFRFLLKAHPRVLLGGFDRKDWLGTLLLTTFWKNFNQCFPDHELFSIHDRDRWGRCLPFYLHIDEGTGLKKGAVLVLSWQTVFGRETSEVYGSNRDIHDVEERMTWSQMHNAKGSTYLTRFLYTALPKKTYGGKRNQTYYKVLDLLSQECKDLMKFGITIHGEVWYPCCLGMKGDQPALIKSGKFKRSFYNLGDGRGCCWECLAGFDGFPWEEISPEPKWSSTIGLTDPWLPEDPSPLMQVPGYGKAHEFWRRDPFHAFKQSIGGHFAASLIVLFAVDIGLWMGEGLSCAVDEVLERAFVDFRYWVRHEWRGKVTNHVVAFTRAILHFGDMLKFPYARFKGSDQMLILRWLRHVILEGVFLDGAVTRSGVSLRANTPDQWQLHVFENALKGCEGGINFFHALHRGGVWLSRETTKYMALECYKFCVAYQSLALQCHGKSLARFHLEPSLHTMMHFYYDLSHGGHIFLSPATATTEMDEDFIGKICRGCRNIHAGVTTKRCIDRYLIRCHFEFENV